MAWPLCLWRKNPENGHWQRWKWSSLHQFCICSVCISNSYSHFTIFLAESTQVCPNFIQFGHVFSTLWFANPLFIVQWDISLSKPNRCFSPSCMARTQCPQLNLGRSALMQLFWFPASLVRRFFGGSPSGVHLLRGGTYNSHRLGALGYWNLAWRKIMKNPPHLYNEMFYLCIYHYLSILKLEIAIISKVRFYYSYSKLFPIRFNTRTTTRGCAQCPKNGPGLHIASEVRIKKNQSSTSLCQIPKSHGWSSFLLKRKHI